MIVIQHITTQWTKLSRGAPNAIKRNAVPEVFPIVVSNIQTLDTPVFVHKLRFYERHNFVNPREEFEKFELKDPMQFDSVSITKEGDQIKVCYYHIASQKSFVIPTNEWSKMLCNKKYIGDYDGNWFYEKLVINIGNFTHFNSNIFLSQTPSYIYNQMRYLN